MPEKTIFQKIIEGEIPCTKVYEDDTCIAFLDIHPVHKGHTLLVPKEHYKWMQDAPDELVSSLFITAKRLMIAMKQALAADYIQVSVVGKDVPHFHIHLIPRHFDEPNTLHARPEESYKNPDEMSDFAARIAGAL